LLCRGCFAASQLRSQFILNKILCDGIREPVSGSLLYGNNIITGAVIPTSNAIGLHSQECVLISNKRNEPGELSGKLNQLKNSKTIVFYAQKLANSNKLLVKLY
jgi:hypothetical protein